MILELLDTFTDLATPTGVRSDNPVATKISVTWLYDALAAAQDKLTTLRSETLALEFAECGYRVGRLLLVLGDDAAAISILRESCRTPDLPDALRTGIRISLAQALRSAGNYIEAKTELDALFADPELGSQPYAVCLVTLALYERDHRLLESAREHCLQALTALDAGGTPYHAILCCLTLADIHIREGNLAAASDLIQRADDIARIRTIAWFRPAWWAIKARAAYVDADYKMAAKFAAKGLSAEDNYGDLAALSTLYRIMAAAYERRHERIDDATDARTRAVTVARSRGSRLELADALFELGWHYKLFANRPTVRARGSGLLFEADKLFQAMGLETPVHVGSVNPLL